MPEAKAEKKAKTTIPKRIMNKLDAAFLAYEMSDQHDPDATKARKKVAKERAEVVAYIEGLIAGIDQHVSG